MATGHRGVTSWTRSTHRLPATPWEPLVAVRPDVAHRPPIGPPLAGSRATAGGRAYLQANTPDARDRRATLALRAFFLRTEEGRSIRDIAAQLGVGKSTVGKWLYGVYPGPGHLPAGSLWRRSGGQFPRSTTPAWPDTFPQTRPVPAPAARARDTVERWLADAGSPRCTGCEAQACRIGCRKQRGGGGGGALPAV